MTRSAIEPISRAIPASRQAEARHYGVHPYFTRRPANVVRAYIERYSQEGDVVLDPFGGTGVTAIEAFLLGRHAIHNDLNPFANFITRNIGDTSLPSTLPLREAFQDIEQRCAEQVGRLDGPDGEKLARELLKELPLPANIRLPRNSDAEFFYDMFTPRQLAGLALIKRSIDQLQGPVHNLLLLAWSASVAKLNKTFLSAKGRAASRGGSSIFSIYRYKLAAKNVELPIWETFNGRFANVLAAKEEIARIQKYVYARDKRLLDSDKDLKILELDATALERAIEPGSVDYIFTDPPYGAFISYLDLSILWNHWLGFNVSEQARQSETIVGGENALSEDHYRQSLSDSIKTCFKLLRPDRWLSIVFQHWDISYFSTILDTADACGASLKAAITQTDDVIWSMHKKKNSESVIAGEMILTFYKPSRKPRAARRRLPSPAQQPKVELSKVFEACIPENKSTFTTEFLFNRLIIELWSRDSLACLALDRREFVDHLRRLGWVYSPASHRWSKGAASVATMDDPTLF